MVWGFRFRIHKGVFGQGILRPEGRFFMDRGEERKL